MVRAYVLASTLTHLHMHISCTHIHTHVHTYVCVHTYTHTHTHTGLTPESVSLNGTFEISHNVFQENEAGDLGAAVALPLQTAFTVRTQMVTVFQDK